jgi:small subunit ribosomal protein S1
MDLSETTTNIETPEDVMDDVLDNEDAEIQQAEVAEATEDAEAAETGEMGELPLADWDYQRPKRGQVRTGVILAIREQEIIVGVDAKRDGVVPYADMQRLGPEALKELSVGDQIPVYILRPEDADGNLLVSLFQARTEKAWQRAAELAESGELWEGEVIGFNKGGLVMPLDEIRGFIPASQVPGFPHGLSQEERLQRLSEMVGEKLKVKVIEINRRNRRLILSATSAHRQWRKRQRELLLEDLREGEVRTGVVSSLCSFGAFVDLGGADGLVHISELSWQRVRHPREVVNVGDKVDVYVLRLDPDKKRIGLSLKRLQPEPWALVEDKYELGQLVEGTVTNVVDFGAFAEIDEGIEGLIHISELTEGTISHPREVVKKGDLLLLRIIRIDARRKRLGLSLKRVLESEWSEWAARLAQAEEKRKAEKEAERSLEAREESKETTEVSESLDAEGVTEEAPEVAESPAAKDVTEEATEASESLDAEGVTEEATEVAESPAAKDVTEDASEVVESPEPPAAEMEDLDTAEQAIDDVKEAVPELELATTTV